MTSPELLAKIRAFLAKSGMGPSYFGYLAANDGKLVDRLEAGGEVTLAKASQILRFIEDREAAKAEEK
jgi:hypothetical protein